MRQGLNPAKVARIAVREYLSTVLTKGFIIGVFIVPVILIAVMPLIGVLSAAARPPSVGGRIALFDRTERLGDDIAGALSLEALSAGREATAARAKEVAQRLAGPAAEGINQAAGAGLDSALGSVPRLTVQTLPRDADLGPIEEELRAAMRDELPLSDPSGRRLLGVLIVSADALEKSGETGAYGGFELLVDKKLDKRTVETVADAVEGAIRDARTRALGYDPGELAAVRSVARETREVTESGTRESNEALSLLLPGVFMLLILMSVFTGGQYLLTTTIEEKSSRVVEVLLSSVSPVELMTGKIFGQMGVGLTLLTIYAGLGVSALVVVFAAADLVQPMQIVYMLIFFVLAYFMFGSMMAAAGAAVNELREAQSLMTPIMLLAGIPYFLFLPVSLAPAAPYSVVLSFLPPVNPFIMMIRVASTDPPPTWQVLLSIGVGVIGSVGLVWATAKIFRVGLLMYGKPPNLATMIRWIRMA